MTDESRALTSDLSGLYDAEYYRSYCGSEPYERTPNWLSFFSNISRHIVDGLRPTRVLDAGCAWGFLVEALRDFGVDASGVDFSDFAISQVRTDIKPHCKVASLVDAIDGGPFDLVTCIEVLEHMTAEDGLQAIKNITRVSDQVIFSSSPDDHDEPTHINVQPTTYWLNAFAEEGFSPDFSFNASYITPHAFLVRRSDTPCSDEQIALFARILRFRASQADVSGSWDPTDVDVERSNLSRRDLEWRAYVASRLLREVRSSPGWHFVSRYRSLLKDAHNRFPRVLRIWERLARAVLSRSGALDGDRPESSPRETGSYAEWISCCEPASEELCEQSRKSEHLSHRPTISIVMPVYKISERILRAAIESLKAQSYEKWELCATVIPAVNLRGAILLRQAANADSRIKILELETNHGISANSDQALALASGEFVALLDHDDTLAPFALFEVASLISADRSANFIYSDRDEITEDGRKRILPFFKPDWSPDVMLTANYLTHLCVMRTEHIRAVGGWRSETDGAQDWDLFLRVIHRFGGVRHIPKILYHWRNVRTSVSAGGARAKPYAAAAQVRAVQEYCSQLNIDLPVQLIDECPAIAWNSIKGPSVSIIVIAQTPGSDSVSVAESVARRPECERVEVLCSASQGQESATGVKLVAATDEEPLERQITRIAEAAQGDILVFLDESIQLDESDWLRELTGPLQIPGVGLVGCHLIDPETGATGHGGLVFDDAGAVHCYRPIARQVEFTPGYDLWLRNWSAVSGACFAIRRDTWESVGGVNAPSQHSRLDVRLCLKLINQDLRIASTPKVKPHHKGLAVFERPTHANTAEDQSIVRSHFPSGDPYVNPNLEYVKGHFTYRHH